MFYRSNNEQYKNVINCVMNYLCKNEIASFFSDKKLLFVGASGLIGSFFIDLINLLNEKENANISVTAIGRDKDKLQRLFSEYTGSKNISFFSHDVTKKIPEIGDFDFIINAASNTHPVEYSTDPIGTITTNVLGTNNLLEYAVSHNVARFMFLSTVEVYGEDLSGNKDFSESDFGHIDCNTLRAGYPESKRVCESLCQAYMQKYGIHIVIPRICRVYGPTMQNDDSKALAQFIRNAINSEDIILKSDGNQFYSYIDVFDCVTALLTILAKGKNGEAYNISSVKSDISLKDLAERISEKTNTKVVFDLPNDTEKRGFSKATRAILKNDKLRSLGWREIYDIDSGISLTLDILKGCGSDCIR